MERLVCDIYGVETRLLTASSRFLVNGVLIRKFGKKAAGQRSQTDMFKVHYKSCCDVGCWSLNMNQSSLKIIAGRASGGFEGTRHPRADAVGR
jgi:hypothetical protein